MSLAIATNMPARREPLMLLLQANVHATIPGDPCARDRLVVTTAASR